MNTKKKSVWTVLTGVLLCLAAGAGFLLLTSCENGGAGADFDATQYYTKTEIDDSFYTKTEIDGSFYSSTEVDAEISDVSPLTGDGDPQWLSSTAGYANKTAGWDVPEGAGSVLVKARIMAPIGSNLTIYIDSSESGAQGWNLTNGTGSEILMLFSVAGKDHVYAWTDNSPGSDNVEVAPFIWLR